MTHCSLLIALRYDHPHVLAGCGTIGLEIAEQVPDVDAVIVPIGGGGLLAGITVVFKALKPNVQVIVNIFCFFLIYVLSYIKI